MNDGPPYNGFIVDKLVTNNTTNTSLVKATVEPKEKVYQFSSTVKAWKSKYLRHIGVKQVRKQLNLELKDLPENVLVDLATRFKTSLSTKNFPTRLISVYQERFTFYLKRFNINYETDVPTSSPTSPE